MIFKDDPEITMFDLNKKNVGGADVYGLLPDDDVNSMDGSLTTSSSEAETSVPHSST